MKMNINYNMLEVDTNNGYGIQVHFTFTSFNRKEIEEIKEWCEEKIGNGLVREHIKFKAESEE